MCRENLIRCEMCVNSLQKRACKCSCTEVEDATSSWLALWCKPTPMIGRIHDVTNDCGLIIATSTLSQHGIERSSLRSFANDRERSTVIKVTRKRLRSCHKQRHQNALGEVCRFLFCLSFFIFVAQHRVDVYVSKCFYCFCCILVHCGFYQNY